MGELFVAWERSILYSASHSTNHQSLLASFESLPLAGSPPSSPHTVTNSPSLLPLTRIASVTTIVDLNSINAAVAEHPTSIPLPRVATAPEDTSHSNATSGTENGRRSSSASASNRRGSNNSDSVPLPVAAGTLPGATSPSISPNRINRRGASPPLDNAIQEEQDQLRQPQHSTRALTRVLSVEGAPVVQKPNTTGQTPSAGSGLQTTRTGVDIARTELPVKENRLRSQSQRSSRQRPGVHSVFELAVEGLFRKFEEQAAAKTKQFATEEDAPRLEELCGRGVDAAFDQLVFAMGSVARTKPKPLVEKLITWRQNQTSNTAVGSPTSMILQAPFEPERSPRESILPFRNTSHIGNTKLTVVNSNSAITEKTAAASTYLICRVLVEIFGQSDPQSIGQELANRLEDMIYKSQLKPVTQEMLEKSPTRLAKWNLSSRLLGIMAEKDFDGVSTRFLTDLRICQKMIGVKAHGDRKAEDEAVLLLKGMHYVRLKFDSDISWSKSVAFFNSIAELFIEVHGQAAKLAYAQVISKLLLNPAAHKPRLNFELAPWRKAIRALTDRFALLALKPKYWPTAFPVQALLICVAPYDVFSAKWQSLISSMPPRLREKNCRATVLRAACRLVWSYVQRGFQKEDYAGKLEEIVRTVLLPTKKFPISAEQSTAVSAVQLIRIIGHKDLELCFRLIIFPLLNADTLLNSKDLKVDHLDPDRMIIGIRGFLAIMSDHENNEQPPFPLFDDSETGTASFARSVQSAQSLKPIAISGFAENVKNNYSRFCEVLGKIAFTCDQAFGSQAMLDQKPAPAVPKTPSIEGWNIIRKDDGANDERQAYFELLHAAILALPRCSSPQIPVGNMTTLLCNGIAHFDMNIAVSSATSLKSMARQGYAQYVVARLSNHLQQLDMQASAFSTNLMSSVHLENTLSLYADLVNIWIRDIMAKKKKTATDRSDDLKSTQRALGLDNSAIWTQIDKVESQSLLFLCSPSPQVRSYAVELLKLVTKFDAVHGEDNIRIANILQEDFSKVVDPNDENFTVGERSRLKHGHRAGDASHVLIDLCCSPNGEVNATLWFKLFPMVLRRIFEACPMAATQTREDISIRLSHMHPMIDTAPDRSRSHSVFEGGPSRSIKRSSSASTIEQWKLYLVFVCTTLTRAEAKSQTGALELISNHARKSSKSSQSAPELFTTAKDLFQRVIPMLASENVHVRNAAVVGLGSIHVNLYKPLLESMETVTQTRVEDTKKPQNPHQRGTSSPRRHTPSDHFRTDVAHVYKLTSIFLQKPEVLNDEWILKHIAGYTTELYHFLQRVEGDQDYQQLRTHYCALIEAFFTGLNTRTDPQRWMPFQTRRAAFTSLEEWCGHATPRHQRETGTTRNTNLRQSESERPDVKNCAHSAMASLCVCCFSIPSLTANYLLIRRAQLQSPSTVNHWRSISSVCFHG